MTLWPCHAVVVACTKCQHTMVVRSLDEWRTRETEHLGTGGNSVAASRSSNFQFRGVTNMKGWPWPLSELEKTPGGSNKLTLNIRCGWLLPRNFSHGCAAVFRLILLFSR